MAIQQVLKTYGPINLSKVSPLNKSCLILWVSIIVH